MIEGPMTDQQSPPPAIAGEVGSIDYAVREHRSLWGDAWRRLLSSKTGRIGLVLVTFFFVATVLTHFFWEYDPRTDLDYSLKLKPPNLVPNEDVASVHPFGTDKLGRDIFTRVAHGGWNSLRVGLIAVTISLLIGGLLGLLAGFYESMPMGNRGRAFIAGCIGLILGAWSAWIANQWFQVILFVALALVAALWTNLLAGKSYRMIAFGIAGLLLAGIPALLVSPLTALACAMLGLISGVIVSIPFNGTVISSTIMRAMDVLLAFPGILLAIAIVAMLGPGLNKGMIAIGIVGIPIYARLVRATVLSVIQQEYVAAALSVGAGQGRILFRHILPNTLSPLTVQATMGLASAILYAGALGFLGLGAIPPEPEWGAMLGDSYRYLTTGAWWAVTFPGIAIMIAVLGFNLLGDGLRDALDPRLQT
jgi:ABC-type dipeptide/oligopeptide/nickel transport system permease subunit